MKNSTNRTEAQSNALAILNRDGVVFAGSNVHKGRTEFVFASSLKALARQGIVTIHTSPDGGLMARKADVE